MRTPFYGVTELWPEGTSVVVRKTDGSHNTSHLVLLGGKESRELKRRESRGGGCQRSPQRTEH